MQRIMIFFLLFTSLFLNAAVYKAKLEIGHSPCMCLTSDKEKLVTLTMGRLNVWRSENLELLGGLRSVRQAGNCQLSSDDRFFIFNSTQEIYIYDIQKMKLHKKLKGAPKQLILKMSLSKEGGYVNTLEGKSSNTYAAHKEIYRYNIETGKAAHILKLKVRSAEYLLHEDTLYVYDDVQKRAYAFDILSKDSKDIDVKVFDAYKAALQDPHCASMHTYKDICIIDKNVVYEFNEGIVRRELNTTALDETVVTYQKSNPLKAEPFFELGIKGDIVVEKGFNVYRAWDIKKGRQKWVKDLKLIMSVEDSEATRGIAFFNHKNHVLITPPFGGVYGEAGNRRGGIMDFDLNDGSFTNLDVAHTGAIGLSADDKILAIRSYDKKVYYYETENYRLLTEKDLRRLKKQVDSATKMLTPIVREPWRRGLYEIEDEKYNYTVYKDGLVLKSEIYSGLVVAKKYLTSRRANKLKLIDHGRKMLVSQRGLFGIYRTDDFKELAKFYSFKEGEWLVMTPQGYFNASSQAVLPNIFKMQKIEATVVNKKQLLEQKFRPDIVTALLQERDIKALVKKENNYKLFMQAQENPDAVDAFYAKIKKERDYRALLKEVKSRDQKALKLVYTMIEDAKSNKEYKYAYKLLSQFPFAPQKRFIEKKVYQTKLTRAEQNALVYALFKNRDKAAREFAVQLLDDNTVPKSLKTVIRKKKRAQMVWALGSLLPEEFPKKSAFLWEVFENDEHLTEALLQYLHKSDALRYEQHLREKIIESYQRGITLKTDPKERLIADLKLHDYYSKLKEIKSDIDVKMLSAIATEMIQKYFEGTTKLNDIDVFYQFVARYGTLEERKKVAAYLKRAIESTTLDASYGVALKFQSLLKSYALYDHEDSVKLLLTYASDKFQRNYFYVFRLMGQIKDPRFVPVLLKYLVVEEGVLSREALNALLVYDNDVVMEVVKVLNTFKDCSDIPDLARVNSTIEMKLNAQEFKQYRCGNE